MKVLRMIKIDKTINDRWWNMRHAGMTGKLTMRML